MAADPTLQKLPELVTQLQWSALELVNRVRSVGGPLVIVEALRSPTRQAQLVAQGASQTQNSRHLVGRAFDVAWLVNGTLTWNVPQSWWDWIGPEGEALGLTWGGRWRTLRDFGHFEH